MRLYTNRAKLKIFFPQECKPFLCGGKQHRYILPCEFVEIKQYRPLTIDEFLNRFDIGEVIVFRSKAMPDYVLNEVAIILGQHRYSLNDLFTNYEYDGGDNWFNFGAEQ